VGQLFYFQDAKSRSADYNFPFSAEIPVVSIQSEKIKSQTTLQDSGIFY
jgi:hypothetical protein